MSRPTGDERFFPKVREAREAIRAKALETYQLYLEIIQAAIDKGDLETAAEHTQWLLEHTPKGDDGERVIDESAAKPKQIEQKQGPSVNIGFALGGLGERRSLPAVTIDVEPVDAPDIEAIRPND